MEVSAPSPGHVYGCWRSTPRETLNTPLRVQAGTTPVHRMEGNDTLRVGVYRMHTPAWLPIPCGHDFRSTDGSCDGCWYQHKQVKEQA